MKKTVSILLFGPSRTAASGVSTHVNQLLESSLAQDFALEYFQVGSVEHEKFYQTLFRLVCSPLALLFVLLIRRPDIVHLNTSTNLRGFWRDVVYLIIAKLLRRSVVYQVQGGDSPTDFCQDRWYMISSFSGSCHCQMR